MSFAVGVGVLCGWLSLCSGLATLNQRAAKDQIKTLPGLKGSLPVRQFSGYINAAPNRHLHYWHLESQGSPTKDPLVVWFNGGPGCSSLEGFLTELGSLHIANDGISVFQNPYAWNKIANMLYIEGPTRVGFSYSDGFSDDKTNDTRTSGDFARAIGDFLANVRPDYQSRDLYITGESYAGVYIPITANYILDAMAKGTFKGRLVGVAIGNGILSEMHQHNSIVDFMYYHGVVGSQLWAQLKAVCCPNSCTATCNFYAHLKSGSYASDGTACGRLVYQVSETMEWDTPNDPYNLYQDCYKMGTLATARQRSHRLWRRPLQAAAAAATSASPKKTYAALFNSKSTDANSGFACWGESAMTKYLNRADVQKAIHIPAAVTGNPAWKKEGGWGGCNDYVFQTFNRTEFEMDKWVQRLVYRSGLRILIYNGDVDMVCNYLGDEWFMDKQMTSVFPGPQPRGPWFYRSQIGGYAQSWDRVDVATVKGAGHFVPTDRPGPALQMIANFIRHTRNYSMPLSS